MRARFLPHRTRWIALLVGLAACAGHDGSSPAPATPTSAGSAEQPAAPHPLGPGALVDVTTDRGLPAMEGELPDGSYAMPEILGQGVGFFDADGDGRLDLVQPTCRLPWTDTERVPTRLWMQREDGTFRDEAGARGLGDDADSFGVTAADYDGDGAQDVLLLNFGRDRLYRGRGDGTFEDASDAVGLVSDDWGVAGAWLDHDRDGDLDLFVVNYVRWEAATTCLAGTGQVEYCGPDAFDPWPDVLYENQGDGRLVDVTVAAGVARPGSGLGVVTADLTADGWIDLYVTNDMRENHLWVNRRDGTFREEAMLRGVGVNGSGQPEASMGICVEDVDADGSLDLFMTHIVGQTNTLYSALREGIWSDVTARSGMAKTDTETTGFGCVFFDLEHDGDLDLLVANGAVLRRLNTEPSKLGAFWSSYGEPDHLYANDGAGHLSPVERAAPDFTGPVRVSRGLALGDVDGDGDQDVALHALGNRLRLFENRATPRGHWLRVDARVGARTAIGAQVEVVAGDHRGVRVLSPTFSYASSSEPVVHFGLGEHARYDELVVDWPDGTRERFDGGAADRTVLLRPGTGTPLDTSR